MQSGKLFKAVRAYHTWLSGEEVIELGDGLRQTPPPLAFVAPNFAKVRPPGVWIRFLCGVEAEARFTTHQMSADHARICLAVFSAKLFLTRIFHDER